MDLYGELILDHAKRPRHAGLREPYDVEVNHVNPTCGDEISLRVHVVGEGQHVKLRCSTPPATLISTILIGFRYFSHRASATCKPFNLSLLTSACSQRTKSN